MGSLATLYDLTERLAWDLDAAPAEWLDEAAKLLRATHLRQARGEDVRAFDGGPLPRGAAALVEYALTHELTGDALVNAGFHEVWQAFLDAHDLAVIFAPVGHGKTQQVLGRVLSELGKNPNLRIGIVCSTDAQARTRVMQLREVLRTNARLREVFPSLEIDPDTKQTEHEFTIRRTTTAKDPSVRGYGVGSKDLQGARLDILILDDVCDRDNTATPEQRAKLIEWFDAIAFARQTPGQRFRVWAIGTPWTADDLLHVLAARPGFASQTWSAVLNPDEPQLEWRTLWDAFTAPHARHIYANTTPQAFARKYLCRVYDAATQRFREEWIRLCLERGAGRTLLDAVPLDAHGRMLPTFTGVDLGVGEKPGRDISALVTIALLPDGRRLLVDVQAGRWTGPDIVSKIVRTARRYHSIVVVESNAAQEFITQFAGDADDLPIEPFYTGRNKWDEDFGIETLAVELRAGRWILPANEAGEASDPEVKALVQSFRDYRPEEHTPDRLIALWIARERARMYSGEQAGALAGMTDR